jgi:hypothetical protein
MCKVKGQDAYTNAAVAGLPRPQAAQLSCLANNIPYDIIVLQQFAALCAAEINGRYREKSFIA